MHNLGDREHITRKLLLKHMKHRTKPAASWGWWKDYTLHSLRRPWYWCNSGPCILEYSAPSFSTTTNDFPWMLECILHLEQFPYQEHMCRPHQQGLLADTKILANYNHDRKSWAWAETWQPNWLGRFPTTDERIIAVLECKHLDHPSVIGNTYKRGSIARLPQEHLWSAICRARIDGLRLETIGHICPDTANTFSTSVWTKK